MFVYVLSDCAALAVSA